MATTTIQLKGQVFWKLVFEYNNSTNAGTITQSYTSKNFTESHRSTFMETVSKVTVNTLLKVGASAEVEASYGAVSGKVSTTFESSKEVNDMLQNTTRTSGLDITKSETETVRKYDVGPNSKLNLYQQCFTAPGMSAAFDVFSTEPTRANSTQEIVIDVVVEKIDFITNLQVVYTDNASSAPNDRLREINGGNADVNGGFKGKYVWLVPVYSSITSQGVTSFDFVNQGGADSRYLDLAKDAGGDYRYLIPVVNTREKTKLSQCAMLRSGGAVSLDQVQSWGWSGMSADLNRGRKGDYLYVLWKTRYAY